MSSESSKPTATLRSVQYHPIRKPVIPKRHALGYSELGRPELNACHRLLEQEKRTIE